MSTAPATAPERSATSPTQHEASAPLAPLELADLRHPSENSRFWIAVLVCAPAVLVGLALTVATAGLLLIFVGALVAVAWIASRISRALLLGSAIRVAEDNFSEIWELTQAVKRHLGYTKEVEVYIIEEGSTNAILQSFFRTRAITLHSGLVEATYEPSSRREIEFVVARFIGALRAKHLRLQPLALLVASIEKLQIFNLFLLPYERATCYSGDQIGLDTCGDLSAAISALNKMHAGKVLAPTVRVEGILSQAEDVRRDVFGFLARLFLSHPHAVHRYENLLGFAAAKRPDLLAQFADGHDADTVAAIEHCASRSCHRVPKPST